MQATPTPGKRFQILSVDGGGLKGLFAARFLMEWEQATKRPVASAFDLIAGTSSGGIIALALGVGLPAKEIVDFFRTDGPKIFPHEGLGTLRQVVGSRYDPERLEHALSGYFGDRQLGDSQTRLVIPAYRPPDGIHIFKTPHHPRLQVDRQERMVDIARATSAAPTYLPPHEVEPGFRLIDGGTWANNPVQIAVNEALGYLGVPREQVTALRIGGPTEVLSTNSYPGDVGLLDCLKIVDVMMRGQSQAASGGAKALLGQERYVEVTLPVLPNEYRLDLLSEDLSGRARTQFRETSSDLRELGFLDHEAAPFHPLPEP